MLNSETKRHIDAARDVLVGVAPNPTTQIDQITYALIYKFMDDMDQASVKAGGEASFFVEDLAKYAWSNLMSTRMGNQEKMDLYSEALTKFSEAKQLPELFRTIFRAAFLPYRSPETLGLFLKEIAYFDYTHPEELGNAYEYLLSIMSSQGDAGQFRTPRHIIDFIVDVINPTKEDKVLDPACGTAGFLVSAYNHILEQHDGQNDLNKSEKPLTPDERKKLMSNLHGYDIDPTMVRIAQVNMYLHQFKNPQIFQYDSLTNEERWAEKYDVILANPPFMSPKGGIKPHNKFGVSSNRAEVLFVDYILNHLKPNGRAGIVVPEGVIFQNGIAYKSLRKNLVENGLYAVVSLPSGVFQPYSGVKTSVLLIDNSLAKQRDDIAFLKISADGFDLGSTKRVITSNDLPEALRVLHLIQGGISPESSLVSFVSKCKLQEAGDYNLSGDRYKTSLTSRDSYWPQIPLGELVDVINGFAFKSDLYSNKGIRVIRITNVQKGFIKDDDPKYYPESESTELGKYFLKENDLLVSLTGNVGRVALLPSSFLPAALNQRVACLRKKQDIELVEKYLFHMLNLGNFEHECINASSGVAQKNLSTEWLKTFEIPVPGMEVQQQIVSELDQYAAIITGAKQIIDNWSPKLSLNPTWEMRELGDLCDVYQPKTITGSEIQEFGPYKVYGANGVIGYYDKFNHAEAEVAITCRGATCGTVNFTEPESWITGNAMVVSPKQEILDKKFLLYLMTSTDLSPVITGSAQPQITGASLKPFQIPVPTIDEQKDIVGMIDDEASRVESAKSLIEIYQKKSRDVINRLWSENSGND